MKSSIKLFFLLPMIVLSIGISIGYYQRKSNENKAKELVEWAHKNKLQIDKSKIKSNPFKIIFDEKEWDSLLKKLSTTRYFEPSNDVARFEHGFDCEYAKELVEYWRTKFDWKSKVDYLNKFPQYQISLNDTIIHYLHVVTNKEKENLKRVPLLLIDGWPGSFFLFYKMIDYISANYKDVSYDIIVPSIPGYGYSTPLKKPVETVETAFLFDALMRYENGENSGYYVHGEDWGAIIATNMAQLFPSRVKAIHITMPTVMETSDIFSFVYTIGVNLFPSFFLTENELRLNISSYYSLPYRFKTGLRETGYMHLQATRPDTVGHGLTDSPVGLLAYILEKYSSWTFLRTDIVGKKDGGLEAFNKDDLLTIITIYWMSNSITSSMRYYANSIPKIFNPDPNHPKIFNLRTPEQVAVGVQLSTTELFVVPSKIVQLKYTNLKWFNIFENGSHFSAFFKPDLTSIDFISFINSI